MAKGNNRLGNINKWRAGKLPAFLIDYPRGSELIFNAEEANERFEEIAQTADHVAMYSTKYSELDPSYIAPNGNGIEDYLRHYKVRALYDVRA